MRTISLILSCVLVAALLLTGCGEGVPPAETATPPETTIPFETTLPTEMVSAITETTAPIAAEPEVTAPPVEDHPLYNVMLQGQFEYHQGKAWLTSDQQVDWAVIYKYSGTSSEILIPGSNMTLTLPEGWLEQVSVFHTGVSPDVSIVYIVNNRIILANRDAFLIRNPNTSPEEIEDEYHDFILKLTKHPKKYYDYDPHHPDHNPYDPDEGIYLGEDEDFYYFAVLPGDERYDNNWYFAQYFLKEAIGEDAYNELVGDLVLDYDTVREMVTIHSEIDPSE